MPVIRTLSTKLATRLIGFRYNWNYYRFEIGASGGTRGLLLPCGEAGDPGGRLPTWVKNNPNHTARSIAGYPRCPIN
jgi:hypothetical protein